MRATWVTPGLVRTLRARGWVVPVTAFTAAAALVTGLLVGVAGPGEARTPSGKTPGGSGVATATGPLTAADLASAVATARLRKARVEVLGLGTDRSRTWVNPGGTLTTQTFELPVRYRVGGRWVDVDTTLAAGADGSVAPRGHVRGLRLAGAGAGSNPTLVEEAVGSQKLSVGWRGRLPKPVLDADTATYPEVTPGADVTVRATRTGFEENVVLKSRPAAGYSVTIPVTVKGLRAEQSGDGSVVFTDAKGKFAGVIPAPVMWDASVDPRSLEHTRHAPVAMRVAQSGDTVSLTLTPDRGFLDDPSTRYPVTVDPSVSLSTVLDTFAQISYTTPQWSSTDLKLGSYNAGGDVARSFLQFPVQQLDNTKIVSASVNLYEYWSSNCVQSSWELWQTNVAATSTVWTNQPGWMTKYATTEQTKGYPSSCGGAVVAGWVSIDASGFLQYAGDHGYQYANIGVRATTETDSNSWKRF